MDLTALAAIAALFISIGGAFFTWGVMDQKLKDLKEWRVATDERLKQHDIDLREGAVKFEGLSSTLKAIDDRTERIEELLHENLGKPGSR